MSGEAKQPCSRSCKQSFGVSDCSVIPVLWSSRLSGSASSGFHLCRTVEPAMLDYVFQLPVLRFSGLLLCLAWKFLYFLLSSAASMAMLLWSARWLSKAPLRYVPSSSSSYSDPQEQTFAHHSSPHANPRGKSEDSPPRCETLNTRSRRHSRFSRIPERLLRVSDEPSPF